MNSILICGYLSQRFSFLLTRKLFGTLGIQPRFNERHNDSVVRYYFLKIKSSLFNSHLQSFIKICNYFPNILLILLLFNDVLLSVLAKSTH